MMRNDAHRPIILLVDDEEANLDLLEALLLPDGFRNLVRTADARQAMPLFEAHQPDLVLLDLHMPHRSGLEVLRELRARTGADEYLPVLVLTADATAAAREGALAGGAQDFLTKPFDAVEVCLRVRNLLETRRLWLEQRAARKRAEAAEQRARLLADAGEVLGASLDGGTSLEQLTRLLVPRFADLCVATAGQPAAIAVAHADDAQEVALRERVANECAAGDSAPDEARLDALVADTLDGTAAHVITVPVCAGRRVLGTLRIARAARAFEPAELALMEQIAARTALALENAHLLGRAQRAVLARDEVLSIVAHDLRNPLTAIAAHAELLRHQLPPGTPAGHERALQRIERLAYGTHDMVEDLLDVAHAQGESIVQRPAPVRPAVFLDEAEALLQPLAQARSITLRFDGAEPPVVLADAARIVQVLSNLVGNALKFTPEQGTIVVSWRTVDQEWVVTVTDNGPGVPIDRVPQIFAAFWQGDASDRRGVGLGLAIARSIIEAHGGRIWLESPTTGGAAFSFSLHVVNVAHDHGAHTPASSI